MDIPLLLGTMFSESRSRASAIGYVVHFLNGLLFSLVYYAVFRAEGQAGWGFGAVLGVVHALFAGGALVNAILPAVHPHMGTPWSDAEETPHPRAAGLPARELRATHGDREHPGARRVRSDHRRLRGRALAFAPSRPGAAAAVAAPPVEQSLRRRRRRVTHACEFRGYRRPRGRRAENPTQGGGMPWWRRSGVLDLQGEARKALVHRPVELRFVLLRRRPRRASRRSGRAGSRAPPCPFPRAPGSRRSAPRPRRARPGRMRPPPPRTRGSAQPTPFRIDRAAARPHRRSVRAGTRTPA